MEKEIDQEIVIQAIENIKSIFDVRMVYNACSSGFDSWYDGILQLGNYQFACIVKHKVSDYAINTILNECLRNDKSSDLPKLLLTNAISTRQMSILYENGINTLDVAGNCYIHYKDLMMFCQGRKNNNLVIKDTLSFKEPGLKVLYFILTDINHVNLPFRDIQSQTGVGLATINKLFTSLKQNGYMFSSNEGRHLKNTLGLLSIFVDNYCRVMKPKNLMATLRFIQDNNKKWEEFSLPKGMEWGGEPGAFMRDKFLLPEVFDVYSSVSTMQLVSARIAVPAKDGEIKVYRKFWTDNNTTIAPALIIYADLMGSGDSRCIEAAQRIFNHELSYLR